VHRLWSTSWFQDTDAELARLREAYQAAVRDQPPRRHRRRIPPPREAASRRKPAARRKPTTRPGLGGALERLGAADPAVPRRS
jgi:hypothetical protein